jgi:hypothetical protein
MIRKASVFLAAMGMGVLAATQWPDIRRYLKIKQLSVGKGHPQNVPAKGRIKYPQHGS